MLQDYTASSLDEVTVKRSERVEVLNDSTNRWFVKNRMGTQGYVPAIVLEGGAQFGGEKILRVSESLDMIIRENVSLHSEHWIPTRGVGQRGKLTI